MSYNISSQVTTPQINLKSGTFSASLVPSGAPASDVSVLVPNVATTLATTDTAQTLTNKTISGSTNTVHASHLRSATTAIDIVSATAPSSGQALVATSSTTATWTTPSVTTVTGTLPVANGGTGVATLGSGNFLVGAGTSAVVTTKVVPAGTVLGTTDTQTLTNKTITDTTNTVAAKQLLYDGNGGSAGSVNVYTSVSAPAANRVLVASSSSAASWTTPSVSTGNVTGTLVVANGGTGAVTHTSGNFLLGAGTSAVTSAKVAPSGVVIGTTDTQTLTNKTITDATNTVACKQLLYDGNGGSAGAVEFYTGEAAPSATYVLQADSATTAGWRPMLLADTVGVLTVAKGGTGSASFALGSLITGNGSSTFTTTGAPSGNIVGDTDTQTLTNKTISSSTNTVHATHLRTTGTSVSLATAAGPSVGQVLMAGTTISASWQTINVATDVVGTLPVNRGGTGTTAFNDGNVLVASGGIVTTAKAAPAGAFLGTTDTQTLTNKTITGSTNNVHASGLRTATGSLTVDTSAQPTVGQVLMATTTGAAEWTTRWAGGAWIRDVKASGTEGGATAATSFYDRVFALEGTFGNITISVTTGNTFNLTVTGTYYITGSVPGYKVGQHQCFLLNNTTATSIIEGTNADCGTVVGSVSILTGFFVNTGSNAYRIRHYVTLAQAVNGLGRATASGQQEVYTNFMIIRVG